MFRVTKPTELLRNPALHLAASILGYSAVFEADFFVVLIVLINAHDTNALLQTL